MARGISYFGKGGEYISNIKDNNNKVATKTNVVVSTKPTTIINNKWNRSNKLDSDVKSYSGGATACRNNTTQSTKKNLRARARARL